MRYTPFNSSCRLLALVTAVWLVSHTTHAAPPSFSLTTVFDIGGGGCASETQIFEDLVSAADLKNSLINPPPTSARAVWRKANGQVISSTAYFLTTVGCTADRIAISIDGKAHVLSQVRVESLGRPVTYFSDDESSPRVRIERLETLHSLPKQSTDCVQRFERVRIQIEYKSLKRTLKGTSLNQCP